MDDKRASRTFGRRLLPDSALVQDADYSDYVTVAGGSAAGPVKGPIV
jgi:hypothetical protein